MYLYAGSQHRHARTDSYGQGTLPEIDSLPCACDFAVCKFTGTRQIRSLPCAKRGTHGALQTHGKKTFLPCAKK